MGWWRAPGLVSQADIEEAAANPPSPVLAVAGGREFRLVWQNVDALTFEIGPQPGERCFVKWSPVTSRLDLRGEAARMAWAAAYATVPRVLDSGSDDAGSWIVTTPVPGRSAVDPRWVAEPRTAVIAIGEGLRALHDSMPVGSCPFSWSAQSRIDRITQAVESGLAASARGLTEIHQHLTLDEALRLVGATPPEDDLVVCHGDTCAPNTLLTDDGRWSGHVDLGALGVADRWADLAIATWSTTWNYGPQWQQLLLDAYGAKLDEERTRYYRLLWDLDE